MKKTTERVAVWLAVIVMLSGVALSFLSFFRSGGIEQSILFYVGQCMFYSGAIFSGRWYLLYKIHDYVHNEELHITRVNGNQDGPTE